MFFLILLYSRRENYYKLCYILLRYKSKMYHMNSLKKIRLILRNIY